MKATINSLVVLASILVVGAARNAHAGECSNVSLKGAYGFLDGHTLVPAGTPFVTLGRWSFDGKGNFTNTLTFNDNGTVTHAEDFGPYTVNADCTGTIYILGGTGSVEIVIVDGGDEFYGVATNPSAIVVTSSVAKKQFPNAHAGECSNVSLKGAYGFLDGHTLVPAGTPFVTLGRWSFDGKGNFTNTLTFNDNGTVTHAEDFGPYTVNADCTGTIYILGGTGSVEIMIVDGGKEFYGVATNPSAIVVTSSVAKKQSQRR